MEHNDADPHLSLSETPEPENPQVIQESNDGEGGEEKRGSEP